MNVSTRPRKATTAVTAAATGVTDTPSPVAGPEDWRSTAAAVRDAVSNLVFEARGHDEDERDDACGFAKRLMTMVVTELGQTSSSATKAEFETAAFNAEALINGALDLTADRVGPQAEAHLRHALVILDKLTDTTSGGKDVGPIWSAIRSKPSNPKVAAKKAAESAPTSAIWGMHAQQGAHRICEMLYQAEQSDGDGWDNPAREMFSNAEELLYAMRTAPLTDSLWTNKDPASAFTTLKCAKTLLRCAAAEHSARGGLNDLQVASVPVALAMVDELLEALLALPGDMSRLIAFADFSPAASAAVTTPQAAECQENDDETARIKIAFDANYSMAELAKALKQHHAREAGEDWPVYDGILSRIQQLSEVVYYAMRLGGTGPSVTYPSHETLQRFLDGHLGLILRDGP